jgi:hypothetical protein
MDGCVGAVVVGVAVLVVILVGGKDDDDMNPVAGAAMTLYPVGAAMG